METTSLYHPYTKIKLMKRLQLFTFLYILFFVCFTSILYAQQSFNLNGTFEGNRFQFDVNKKEYIKEYHYQFDLIQEGNLVNGTSTIYSQNGDYAVVKIKGMVIGNQFYFEEYSISEQSIEQNMVWCYKSGVLTIKANDNTLTLEGKTESYTSSYGMPCTGGFTSIQKPLDKDNCPGGNCIENAKSSSITDFSLALYPNPTPNQAMIQFSVNEKQAVSVAIFDMNGKEIQSVVDKSLTKGSYEFAVDLSNEYDGMYIVRLSIGDDVYSKPIIKMGK